MKRSSVLFCAYSHLVVVVALAGQPVAASTLSSDVVPGRCFVESEAELSRLFEEVDSEFDKPIIAESAEGEAGWIYRLREAYGGCSRSLNPSRDGAADGKHAPGEIGRKNSISYVDDPNLYTGCLVERPTLVLTRCEAPCDGRLEVLWVGESGERSDPKDESVDYRLALHVSWESLYVGLLQMTPCVLEVSVYQVPIDSEIGGACTTRDLEPHGVPDSPSSVTLDGCASACKVDELRFVAESDGVEVVLLGKEGQCEAKRLPFASILGFSSGSCLGSIGRSEKVRRLNSVP